MRLYSSPPNDDHFDIFTLLRLKAFPLLKLCPLPDSNLCEISFSLYRKYHTDMRTDHTWGETGADKGGGAAGKSLRTNVDESFPCLATLIMIHLLPVGA